MALDRKEFPDASVDLVYLDPPFNSNADYNVLFREPSGQVSQAQFHASSDAGAFWLANRCFILLYYLGWFQSRPMRQSLRAKMRKTTALITVGFTLNGLIADAPAGSQ